MYAENYNKVLYIFPVNLVQNEPKARQWLGIFRPLNLHVQLLFHCIVHPFSGNDDGIPFVVIDYLMYFRFSRVLKSKQMDTLMLSGYAGLFTKSLWIAEQPIVHLWGSNLKWK